MEQKVGEEPVPFDQDACGQREPDGRNHRRSGKKFFHRWQFREGSFGNQRGETVIFESLSVSLPLLNSAMAATGHVAALTTEFSASFRSS